MGFITNLFRGQQQYQAQAGLQPGQLEQTYQQQQDAMQRMAEFAAAVAPGGAQGLAAQQALSGQLAAMGRGEGPSPATALLQQQAGQIGAQQAALAASQRGASQNVGLIGRQAGQAGMQAQQQAASQAAIQRQAEQLSAIQQLQALSGQQVAQQQAGTGMYGESALRAQQQALTAQAQQEEQRTAMARQQESTRGDILGSTLGFAGKMLGKADGGLIDQNDQRPQEEREFDIVEFLNAVKPMAHGEKVPGKAKVEGDSYSNDTVPALLSPGEIVVPRSAAKNPEKAAAFAKSVAMRAKRKKK